MKKNLRIFLGMSFAMLIGRPNLFAQVPQVFNYQGIARDAGGNVLPAHKIGVQLNILDGGPSGTVVSGNFAAINWATGNKYLQTAIDLTGGTSFTLSGTTQLLSVPYALYAQKAVVSVNGAWNLIGNTGAADSNFIGTTDTIPFTVKVNDSLSGKIDPVNFNTYWGYQSGSARSTGIQNTATGYQTLNNTTTGSFNTAVGTQALNSNSTGLNNTAIGNAALRSNTTGFDNTALGFGTLTDNVSGTQNAAGGFFSLFFNTTGNNNTAIGRQALASNQTGYGNVAVGTQALTSNIYGKELIAIGDSALYNFQGLDFNGITITDNLAIGAKALYSNSTGNLNVAIGANTLQNNIDAIQNVAVGAESLTSNTHGSDNSAFGSDALVENTTGSSNTALGFGALFWNTTGSGNTAVGSHALWTNPTIDQTLGNGNTAVGDSADVSNNGLTNATAIGYQALVDASNKVRIGNTNVTVIEGQVPFTTPSDGRFKFNIREDVKGLDFILKLRPVTYQFNTKMQENFMRGTGASGTMASCDEAMMIRRTGFIAQEVEQAAKQIGYDFDGLKIPKTEREYYSLSYASFVVPLVKAVQEQQDVIRKQEQKMQDQDRTIAELVRQMAELRQLIEAAKTSKP